MIKLCAQLDKLGFHRSADKLFAKYVVSQFIQPSNNQNAPISTRVIPWKSVEDSFTQRDKDWFNSPMLRHPDYIPLKGDQDEPAWPSEGGTNNLNPAHASWFNSQLVENLLDVLQTQKLTPSQKRTIRNKIDKLLKGLATYNGMIGSEFDMHGPDEVPGPRNIVHDNYSPSMSGLDGFTWKNRRDVNDNVSDRYKNLLPN